MAITPNMSLDLPSPSITIGPTWASMLNSALELVDSHDHTSGSGVAVPTAGININGTLSFNEYAATDFQYLGLSIQDALITTGSALVYAYDGELYYRDNAGNNVKITNAGTLNSTSTGAILGLVAPASAAYSAGTFTWLEDTGEAAKMALADLVIYEYGAVNPNPITIKSPTGVASAYSIELPGAAPASTYPVTMSSAGVLGVSGTIGLAAGSAASPSMAFAADTNTGFYNIGADQLGLSIGGTLRLTGSTTAFTSTLPWYAPDGTSSAPSLTFSSDPDTGLYKNATNSFAATAGTNVIAFFDGSQATPQLRTNMQGTAAIPAIGIADSNTGIYRPGGNELGIACDGTNVATFALGSAAITGTLDVSGDVTTDNIASSGYISTQSGGSVAWEVFTGTIAGGDTEELTLTNTAEEIIGVAGRWYFSAVGVYYTIPTAFKGQSFSANTGVWFSNATSLTNPASDAFRIYNSESGTATYRIIVFYRDI